jgi:hypothetical protein
MADLYVDFTLLRRRAILNTGGRAMADFCIDFTFLRGALSSILVDGRYR